MFFEKILGGSLGSFSCVFWWNANKCNGVLISDADPISIWNSLPALRGFLSVFCDWNNSIKLLVIASVNIVCVSGLSFILYKQRESS